MTARWTPPEHIDELRIERLLGRGAMAGVWLARDTLLERDVALKIAEGPQTAETRLRLRMEARAVGRLQHPNIVAVHRAGEIADRPFLVTELLGGKSLDLLRLPLALERVISIGADLARGLAAAHAAGVLHRDVKPANAFLCDDGSAKLLDFGLAQLRHASGPPPPSFVAELDEAAAGALASTHAASLSSAGLAGTPLYMAPETWRGEAATRRTDVYSLGAMLFELLTGQPPFAGETLRELRTAVLEGTLDVPAADALTKLGAVTALVTRCLARPPEARPAADDVCHALEALAATTDGADAPGGAAGANPYRGLRAFEPEHRALFFGREVESAAVIAELRTAGLVLVVGPSGAGKSSLVRAGVVPRIAAGALGPRTRPVVMVPGADPVERLAQALAVPLGVDEARLARELLEAPSSLGDRLRTSRRTDDEPPPSGRAAAERIVVVVDQLEEIWTLADPAQRVAFFEATAALVRVRPLASVVATLRSDFLSRLEDLGDLRGGALRAAVVLGPLSTEALRRAIAEPARYRGVTVESALVEHLVQAALAHAAGALPLLEFALAALWDRREPSGTLLGLADLEALGGLEGALAAHADAALDGMPATRRAEARRLLLALVTLERTRARCEGSELALTAPDAAAALDSLVGARLVVASAGDGGTSYELAHEALISEWPTLRGWLDEESGAREVEARLARATDEWWRLGGGRDGLFGERRLEELRMLQGRPSSERQRAFVEASRAAIRKAAWRRRLLVLGIPLVVATAVAGSWGVAALRRRAKVGAVMVEARDLYAKAVDAEAAAGAIRPDALAAFDGGEPARGESLWRTLLEREAAARDARRAVLAVLDRGLSIAPRDRSIRALYADVTLLRILASETMHDDTLLPELRAELPLYDDGSRVALLTAPGLLRVDTEPPGVSLVVSRYRAGRDGHLVEADPERMDGGGRRLDAGSYLLVARSPGRAEARVPFVVARAQELRLHVVLPLAADVPPGMLYVPGGPFLYGSGDDEATRAFLTHVPLHEVDTPSFLVARTEVPYADYLEFLRALPAPARATYIPHSVELPNASGARARVTIGVATLLEGDSYCAPRRPCVDWRRLPVVSVSRGDAAAFASWLDRSGRLPRARLCSDREWELAARGADGRRFPWGEAEPNAEDACVGPGAGDSAASGPCEVGAHARSVSPSGALDMTGNVWEWTASAPDWSTPGLGTQRGGGFGDDGPFLALANRGLVTVDEFDPETGFRVCADFPPEQPTQ